jgi:hypothetical protein
MINYVYLSSLINFNVTCFCLCQGKNRFNSNLMKYLYSIYKSLPIVIIFFSSFFVNKNAWTQVTTFQKVYHTIIHYFNGFPISTAVSPTFDGGYVLIGNGELSGLNNQVVIIRTDTLGDTVWTKTIQNTVSNYHDGRTIKQTSDGGFIIAGDVNIGGYADVLLMKLNAAGQTMWEKNFGGPLGDWGNSIALTQDNGYIISGRYATSDTTSQLYLIKTDSIGNLEWEKRFGSDYENEGMAVVQTNDGGYITTGIHSYDVNTLLSDTYVIRTNALGDTIWTKTYGNQMEFLHSGYDVKQTYDGGFIISGVSFLTGGYVMKTDENGDSLWTKDFVEGAVYSIVQTVDSNYVILSGELYYEIQYLSKLDTLGNIIWSNQLPGVLSHQIQKTSDGGIIIGGYSHSCGKNDLSLTKTDENGNIASSAPPIITVSGPLEFCYGDSVILTTDPYRCHYTWNIGGDTINTTIVKISGRYVVEAIDLNGDYFVSDSVDIYVYYVPVPNISQSGDTLISSSANAYQWFRNDTIIIGATNQTYIPVTTGNYSVTITTIEGCSSTSDFITSFASIDILTNSLNVKIYPNPFVDFTTLYMPPLEDASICIYDIYGNTLQRYFVTDQKTEISLKGKASGLYFYKIYINNQVISTGKLVLAY